MIEIQGVATDRNDVFPYSGMRILGFIQLVNGAIIFVLGVGDLLETVLNYDDDKKKYGGQDFEFDTIVNLTLACTALWCGIWFAVTGSLGTCISRAKAHTLQFFKIAFLVLNILCAAAFGPVCAVTNGVIAMTRHSLAPNNFQWLLTLVVCFLAVLEIIIAIATAAVTCCCSPLRGTQVHVMINQNHDVHELSAEKLNQSFQENASHASRKSHGSHNVNQEQDTPTTRHPDQARASIESRHGPGQAQVPPESHKFDGFADSNNVYGSYNKLKKWALPQW